ncbi:MULTISPECIES: nitrite reductase large subunit NirB [Rhodococcus]|uniref:assimilatory sulfite reductase (ferredoxin) n=1 Tax=Rhodococcus rhodochrous TaxID=1829 RepID=A0AA46WSQ1_RHORH|nr:MULTISPECIES: nitrite reductase large subunit NirB [Rhodococcus]MCB8909263.1 nitrite reductase large subunit NirB [Rhodococcus rhodochrous]MDC3726215.1 nitrite reductase large subunit [Rhodococcus sp. Rp3]MDJ0401168.1 nitrite reductase large subunit NirB [Rhodococcus rhodochrous]MDO1484031.1 nitrite reductase large subunit [Rhodococcus rhodochrous]TWH41570.1 nitrite reductase (NADH) large subunit [Rhodococcus rhodochrous J38]
MSRKNVVVVGHGMVAHRFVEALRVRDEQNSWSVTVLGEEADAAYDRVGLSSYVGAWDRKELALAGNDYAADDLVDLRVGTRAVGIDRAARTVTTAGGDVLPYDSLVLATGSYPFVPPVPGHDLPGCFVYRTLDDLDGIRAAAERAKAAGLAGIVIGGGLLGLEAANALRLLGVTPHVVEYNNRLMPAQVDEGGGRVLDRLVTDLGLVTHTGVGTEKIEAGSEALQVTLSDGSVLEAGLVIFSAGIRPQDELAREAGLELGGRGGVLTDRTCRSTSDEAVYAIGECAAVEGTCYGLVAPGYSTAEVVADRLVGGTAEFPGADLSTKLKLLGVDVASFGDAHATTPGALEVVLSDSAKGTYAKLVVSDDAKTLLGGILVGDASAYGTLRPLVGRELPGDPATLISPVGEKPGAGALPDDAEVCSCNGVTKGAICGAISEGACDIAQIKSCTSAGTTCGGCLPSIKQLLAQSGVQMSKALCEHFEQSRAELFEIVQATGIRTFSALIAQYGTGHGCDICKPVVASILASTDSDHILHPKQAGLQDTNDHFLANIQKNGTYSVVPRMPGGECTPEQLIVIGEVARDFGLYVKMTGGQRVDLFGARVEQLPQIWKRLVDAGMESGQAYGKSLRTVKSCVGSTWCRYGVQDSVGMAVALELRYRGLRSPHKLKMGVSGCARECAEARGKDVGVIATENGWNLYVCGNGGQSPKHAQLLAGGLDDETLVRYIDRFLMFYIRTADRLQRTAPWLDALEGGLEHLKEVVCDDALGIADDLEAAMAKHVEGYKDEWAGVLEDPEKLARFVSFVNAPEQPDPTVRFDDSGPRKVPVLVGMPGIGPGTGA